MKSLSVVFALLCGAATAFGATDAVSRLVEQTMSDPRFAHSIWGIRIEEADGRVIVDVNGATRLIPASNRKLFTAAWVASCAPLDEPIPTDVFLEGEVVRGHLRGDLVIKGWGDPSFGGRFWTDRDRLFAPVLDGLRARRIHQINGAVIADASAFDRQIIPSTWKSGLLGYYYAAPVDAFAYNENVIGTVVTLSGCGASVTLDPAFPEVIDTTECDSGDHFAFHADDRNRVVLEGLLDGRSPSRQVDGLVPVRQPALYAAQALHDYLIRHGVKVVKPASLSTQPASRGTPDIRLQSSLLYEQLGIVLEHSQNLYAEMLLKRTAVSAAGPATYGKALADERMFLTDAAGIAPAEFDFYDGSGLSPDNLVTPRAVIAILRYLAAPERRGVFLELLETPGGEGTLKKRLSGMEGRVFAKTGTINGVAALSGYVFSADGRMRFFSIILNHYTGPSLAARDAIDAIVRAAGEF